MDLLRTENGVVAVHPDQKRDKLAHNAPDAARGLATLFHHRLLIRPAARAAGPLFVFARGKPSVDAFPRFFIQL